jgi:hypothetical protein
MLSVMKIAKRRGKSRHSGIPGFRQYLKSKSENYMNNNWDNIQQQQQEKTISIQQQLEKTISNKKSHEI